MGDRRIPLYVRLPADQAVAIDRIVQTTGIRKQQLVSDMIADHLSVGRLEIMETPALPGGEILTVLEAARLLRVAPSAVEARIDDGGIPARRLGNEWRISRVALMEWLAQGDITVRDTGFRAEERQ
jgi:excisionase family DNA binding protein